MLKWAKPNQRRISECSDASLETCSNISSDSSESGITVPIRYHERRSSHHEKRTNRPKSLALSSTDVLDLDQEHFVSRKVQRNGSTALYSSCSRANRYSMIVTSRDTHEHKTNNNTDTLSNNNNNILKISTTRTSCDDETNTGVLKISTNSEKPKSRNSFWKNLRAKAQGKKSDKKLSKSHSMSNIPDLGQHSDSQSIPETVTPTNDDKSGQVPSDEVTLNGTISNTCPSPVIMRRQQKPLADTVSPDQNKTRTSVIRRRSFKLIKKQNENKKPKPFSKLSDPLGTDDYPIAESPDSGISSIRFPSTTDSDYDSRASPASPITPIDIESNNADLSCLRQQFTDAVLQFLNERLEKKGYATITDRTSSASSIQSDDGAPDIFCYDTDTVARRPSQRINRTSTAQATH